MDGAAAEDIAVGSLGIERAVGDADCNHIHTEGAVRTYVEDNKRDELVDREGVSEGRACGFPDERACGGTPFVV
jgi:hypothetical protein